MSNILFLDDESYRHDIFDERSKGHNITHVYTAKDAISALKTTKFDYVCLDHDLGNMSFVESDGIYETGYTVAKFIAYEMDHADLPIFVVHSWNIVGATNIKNLLQNVTDKIIMAPFCSWVPPQIIDKRRVI